MVREDKPRTVYWLGDKLYLNITNKCSNKCIFCFRNFKRGIGDFTLKLDAEPSFEQVAAELEAAMRRKVWKEVVFCGFGEPTERLDLLLILARCVKWRYEEPVAIRVNTNGHGYMLNAGRDVAAELKAAGVDKVSVSLNAGDALLNDYHDDYVFSEHCCHVLRHLAVRKHESLAYFCDYCLVGVVAFALALETKVAQNHVRGIGEKWYVTKNLELFIGWTTSFT